MQGHLRYVRCLLWACLVIAAAGAWSGVAAAQTKLKWAHVYETSEPFHVWAVWASEEIKKRSNGRFEIQVFGSSSLGKETDTFFAGSFPRELSAVAAQLEPAHAAID